MGDLANHFGVGMWLALAVALASLAVATSRAVQLRGEGKAWLPTASRTLALGSGVIVLAATALPRSGRIEHDGDLVLRPGGAGLGDLDQIIADPTSLAGALLLANVLLYVPVAFFAVIGFGERRRWVLPACLGLSLFVESTQYLVLGRVASTDDVILNMTGALLGFAIAGWVRPRLPPLTRAT